MPSVILPVNWWNNGEFKDQLDLDTMRFTTLAEMFAADATTPKAREYVSAMAACFCPQAACSSRARTDTSGWRFSDNLDTYGFLIAAPGERVYVSSESEDITYSAKVNPDGTLADLKAFAQPRRRKRGGGHAAAMCTSLTGRSSSTHRPENKSAQIDVPERPLQLVFGGADRRTLFILAHHALFAVKVR